MQADETRQPRIVILAGPNGAGKTTSASRLLPRDLDIRQFVNADTIAAGLSAFAPETTAVQAGRVMSWPLASPTCYTLPVPQALSGGLRHSLTATYWTRQEPSVATWGEISRDGLLAAQKLLAEGHWRSSVSRSYYAAYSAISGTLVKRGIAFAHGWNNPSHEQVAALVRNGLTLPIDLRRQMSQAIRRLRVAREGADYHPGATIDRALAVACIHDAGRILRALESTND